MQKDRMDSGFVVDDVHADVQAAIEEIKGRPDPDPNATGTDGPDRDRGAVERKPGDAGDDRGERRDPRGRFAKGAADPKDAPPADPKDRLQADPKDKGAAGPPSSWSVKSKAAWSALPQDVRADIAKREGEIQAGLVALRDFQDLRPWADMAAKQGTTIAAALTRYVGLENLCRQNIAAGLSTVAKNFGLSQAQAATLFADMAKALAVPGSDQGGGQADPLLEVLNPVLAPITKQLGQLQAQVAQRNVADLNTTARGISTAIDTFAANPKNKYFKELEPVITILFEKGLVPNTGNAASDIQVAYDMAARWHPQVHEALIEQRLTGERDAARRKEQEEADAARAASRSLGGLSAPPGTTIGDNRGQTGATDHYSDVLADVHRAMRQHNQV